jgi:ABC-type transporter Mla subunit MlaD
MGDQAERVVLEAEDQVNPVVDKANAGLDGFEKKAESAHGKVIRITDQTRSSVQRLITSLEKQADVYGKSGVERLVAQRDQLLQRYAKEPAAIDAITRSYEKMIAVEEKAAREAAAAKAAKEAEEALRKQSESIRSFGERIGQFIENPVQGAKGAVGSLLSTLGTFGVGVMAGVTALAAFGVAAFEAAKSLGEYGTQVKDAELRTGLTAKEVGQFGFAARAVGQDISIVERLMRGLSQAADENSREGEKARATLQRMGIDLHDAAGELKPTSEILVEISEGLNKLPEGLQRDAAAMDLFKRVGVEAIPFMTELNENLRIAHEQGFGPTEDDVRRFQEYQREVAQLETKWDALVRKFKEGIVITVSWVGKGVDWFLNNIGTAGDDERQHREEEQARQEAEQVRAAGGYGASMSRAGHRRELADMERRAPDIMRDRDATLKRIEDLRTQQQSLVGNFGWVQMLAPTEEEQGRMRKAADIQKEIENLQHMLDAAEQATHRTDLRAGKEETDRLRARFFGTHEGMEKAYSDAKKDVENYRKQLFEPEKPLTGTEVRELSGKLREAEGTEARWKAALDAEKDYSDQLKQFRTEASAFEKKGDEAELSALEKIYRQRDLLLDQAAKVKASEAEIAAIRKSADEQASVLLKKSWDEFEKYDQQRRAEQSKKMMELFLPSKEQLKEWEEVFKAQDRIQDIGVDMQQDVLRRRGEKRARAAETPEDAYRIRVDLAVQLAQIEVARIEREDNAAQRMVRAAEAQKQLFTDLAVAQDELDEKRAEAERKHAEELQREVDEIQKTASGLLHTLFTKPGDFPKQLGNTLHEALLKPVTEGLGGMIASAIHPVIYGSDGQGGIAGIFHGAFGGGKQDPITVTVDNTTATRQNSSAILMLTSVLAGFMGVGAPAMAAPMSISGAAGFSLPAISTPAMGGATAVAASLPAMWGGYSPAGVSSGGTTAASGGYSQAPWASPVGGYSPAPWASNPLAMIMRGGSGAQPGPGGVNSLFSKGGFSQTLSNLKNAVWNEDAWNAYPSTTGGYIAGGIEGVASSPAAGAAGLSLATHGLITDAGTWTGAIQGAAGGALIGNQIGGPLGAAAGASFGFEIGAMEKLFGVKSLNQTAHDDIKSVYGIDIPTNSGTIKQVVEIAKQQFGGSISVAVRSPSVRQLVMLYSEATGQKMLLSATTPYAGSLVEQGGNLYQQASFQNNAWHMYSSNLPTLGGIAGSTYPTPGGPNTAAGVGPTYLSLNVSGAALAPFMTGQYVTPEFVTDQSMAAQGSGYGRTQQAANMNLPGLTVG